MSLSLHVDDSHRTVTIGRTAVYVEFETAAKRYGDHRRRCAGWRCYYRNLPAAVARVWTDGRSDGSVRFEHVENTFGFAASVTLAVWQAKEERERR